MNRALIVIGIAVVLVGLFWKQLSALPFFRLPGDIAIDRPGLKFFFPITTSDRDQPGGVTDPVDIPPLFFFGPQKPARTIRTTRWR